jgi:hypothetical protein
MGDILINSNQTLHDITSGKPDFVGNVHVQSQTGIDFLYGYPSQSELDEGKIELAQSKGGYAMVSVTKPGTGMIALKSKAEISVRIWSDTISAIVATPANIPSPNPLEKSKEKNISLLLWVVVIIALIYVLNKNKK